MATDAHRRRALLLVTPDAILGLLGKSLVDLGEWARVEAIKSSLPPDVQAQTVWWSDSKQVFCVLLTSSHFEIVQDGDTIPEYSFEVSKTQATVKPTTGRRVRIRRRKSNER